MVTNTQPKVHDRVTISDSASPKHPRAGMLTLQTQGGVMKYRRILPFLLVTTGIYAQSNEAFWGKPAAIVKDASGRVTYEERRDASPSTVRVYSNGTCITQRYRPHTTQLQQVDAPDSKEEWLYDKRGP